MATDLTNTFAVAPGTRGLAESGYIPTIPAPKVLDNLWGETFLPEITNNDYEGDIKAFGDSVLIRGLPTITIHRDLADGVNLPFETPYVAPVTLSINKALDWAFKTGMVQAKQTDIKDFQARWMGEATRSLKADLETVMLAYMVTGAAAANSGANSGAISADIELGTSGGTSVTVTKTDIGEKLANMAQILTEAKVPQVGRWAVIPPWFRNLLSISDAADAAKMGDEKSIVRNGRLGQLYGFTLYESVYLPTTTDSGSATCTYIPFGHKMATAFAAQITDSWVRRDPMSNGTNLYSGRMVYGRQVVKPEALGVMVAKKG